MQSTLVLFPGGEDGDRDDREEPEESTGMTSSHTNHEEFKDEEEWGDLSRYHRSSESDESIIAGATPLITSTPPPYRTQGKCGFKGEIEGEVGGKEKGGVGRAEQIP